MTADPVLVLAWLVLAHLVADFVLQTGGIARAKSSHGTRAKREPTGSCQTEESIGSSVKLTNRLTSTATVTVKPN